MVPGINDPKWKNFLNNLGRVPVNDLAAKMLLSRLKLKLNFDNSEATRRQVISDAHAFFTKNETSLQNDIKSILG